MFKRLKKYMPKSLYGRTLMILVLPTVLAQGVAIYMFYERHWDNVSKHMARALTNEIYMVKERSEEFLREGDLQGLEKMLEDSGKYFGSRFKIETPEQMKMESQLYLENRHKIYEQELAKKIDGEFWVGESMDREKVSTNVKLENGDFLRTTSSVKRLFNSTTYIFVMWMVGSTLLLLIIAIMFLKNQIRPVIRLARLANNFGRGQEPPANFKPEGATEVRQASNAFLNMKERISRHIKQRTQMLAGISHDLRTPLTRMRLEIELLKEKTDDPNIDELIHDISDMEKMINSYIDFVRADEEEETEETNLKSLLEEIIHKYKSEGTIIEFECEEDIEMMARQNSLKRAISNLVENSKRFAENIKISIQAEMTNAIIIVEDDGEGIAEDERENVFKPFYRVESSRNPDTGGSGLGLSIVRDIVNGHGGTVALEDAKSEEYKGTRVVIKLPL